MNTLKPVRLKIAWGQWSKGHVFTEMSAGQAEVMVARGIAEYATQDIASPVNRMMAPVRRAGRALVGRSMDV